MHRKFSFSLIVVLLSLSGCVSLPDGIEPVTEFEKERYLGRWYEIARLDHRFERGLTHVTAQYSLNEDGSIHVLNQGFSVPRGTWRQAVGRAKLVGAADVGFLKVSFFGPFYGSYVIFELDHEGYEYAFVGGPNRSYLWLLARSPEISDTLRQHFIQRTEALGFQTAGLIWVDQSPYTAPPIKHE